jgi:hypothetical protein
MDFINILNEQNIFEVAQSWAVRETPDTGIQELCEGTKKIKSVWLESRRSSGV